MVHDWARMDGQTGRRTGGQVDGQADRRVDGRLGRWAGGLTGGRAGFSGESFWEVYSAEFYEDSNCQGEPAVVRTYSGVRKEELRWSQPLWTAEETTYDNWANFGRVW